MGRRSDHTRAELREMIICEGHALVSEGGYAQFSAREVAKRIGYSIGTLYNVFGTYDQLMLAINGRTLDLWHEALLAALDTAEDGRVARAVAAYFTFASTHRNAWMALYDFRLAQGTPLPDFYAEKLAAITGIVVREIEAMLPASRRAEARQLAPSVQAIVHGHCFFALNGTFAQLGEGDPLGAALARVREAISGARPL